MTYDITKMFEHGLWTEYVYENHRWMNELLTCGCTIAACLDTKPSETDLKWLNKQFTKINSLKTLVREVVLAEDAVVKEKVQEFIQEQQDAQQELFEFMYDGRKKYWFLDNTDCNGQQFFVKIAQGKTCKNNF
jgi:hypothetical protein